MTAAIKSAPSSPMTVARGGGGKEGFSTSINTAFSSRNAFKGKESTQKVMSSGPKNPLGREITIPRHNLSPRIPVASNFTRPERAKPNQGLHIDVPYKGTVLGKPRQMDRTPEPPTFKNTRPLIAGTEPVSDRFVPKKEATKALKGNGYITLFDRSKQTPAPVRKENIGERTVPHVSTEKAQLVPASNRMDVVKEHAARAAVATIKAKPMPSEQRTMRIESKIIPQVENPNVAAQSARSENLREQAARAATTVITAKPAFPERVNPQPTIKTVKESVKPEMANSQINNVATIPHVSEIAAQMVRREVSRKTENPVIAHPAVTEPLSTQKQVEQITTNASLAQVREALTQATQPTTPRIDAIVTEPLVRQAERSIQTPQSPFQDRKGVMTTRKIVPIDILRQRAAQKVVQTTRPSNNIPKARIQEIERSIDEPKSEDTARENRLLSRYVTDYLLPKSTDVNTGEQLTHPDITRKIVTRIMTKTHTDPGSQFEAQLLGDPNANSEQVMLKKIQELVTETRVKVQLAKISGTEVEQAERSALATLQTKIKESGMTAMFDKVKTDLLADLMKDATQMPDVKTATEVEPDQKNEQEIGEEVTEEEKKRKEQENGDFQPIEIERDPLADAARRQFLKQAAERAFKEAENDGKNEIHEADIVEAAGDPQKTAIKSEPVRFDSLPDYSITETIIELERSDKPIETLEQADRIIDEKVDRLAPVRTRKNPTQEIRYWTDLVRVFGHLLTPADLHPRAA